MNITKQSHAFSTFLTSYYLSSTSPSLCGQHHLIYLLLWPNLTFYHCAHWQYLLINLCLTSQDGSYTTSIPNTDWECRKNEDFSVDVDTKVLSCSVIWTGLWIQTKWLEERGRLQTKKNRRFNDSRENNTKKSGRLRHKIVKEAASFGILLHLHSCRWDSRCLFSFSSWKHQ